MEVLNILEALGYEIDHKSINKIAKPKKVEAILRAILDCHVLLSAARYRQIFGVVSLSGSYVDLALYFNNFYVIYAISTDILRVKYFTILVCFSKITLNDLTMIASMSSNFLSSDAFENIPILRYMLSRFDLRLDFNEFSLDKQKLGKVIDLFKKFTAVLEEVYNRVDEFVSIMEALNRSLATYRDV